MPRWYMLSIPYSEQLVQYCHTLLSLPSDRNDSISFPPWSVQSFVPWPIMLRSRTKTNIHAAIYDQRSDLLREQVDNYKLPPPWMFVDRSVQHVKELGGL